MTTVTELSQTLNGWFRWMRFRRALTWALRGLVCGLALALAIGLAGVLQARLLRDEFLALVGLSGLIFSPGVGLAAYLWPIQPLKAARYFDLVFHLNERVSTALELYPGKTQTEKASPELVRQQLEDTLQAARAVRPSRDLPLRLHPRDGLLAL